MRVSNALGARFLEDASGCLQLPIEFASKHPRSMVPWACFLICLYFALPGSLDSHGPHGSLVSLTFHGPLGFHQPLGPGVAVFATRNLQVV